MQDEHSIHQLNNDYVKRLRASEVAHNQTQAQLSRRRRGRMWRILLAFAVAMVLCFWAYGRNVASLKKLNHENAQATTQLQTAKQKNSKLNQQVGQLNNDNYLEKLIRDKYLYTKDGETVYNLPTDAK
ncbi:FtsB family cell division protein [Furfurilactobacillus sp. WILCCON 0119]